METGENGPAFGHAKAEKARKTAENMNDPRARENMLAAARCCDRLAALAEETLAKLHDKRKSQRTKPGASPPR